MSTGSTKTKRLLRLVLLFRKQVAEVKRDGIISRDEIVEAVRTKTRAVALRNFDEIHANFIEMNAMSDKRAARHGAEILTGQFILTELFTVHHRSGEILYLQRAQLALADGDRITEQKQANIHAAVQAKKEWDWEWGQIIRPLLVENPTWLYWD